MRSHLRMTPAISAHSLPSCPALYQASALPFFQAMIKSYVTRGRRSMTIDTTIPELDTLQESATTFRDLINESRFHHSLFQQRAKFNLVCSAMDIIDDILFALHSYTRNDHSDQGLAYLEIFGVLQALSVQQDAVSKLHKLITGVPVDLENTYTDIQAICDTRVRVAGHPVGAASLEFISSFATRFPSGDLSSGNLIRLGHIRLST